MLLSFEQGVLGVFGIWGELEVIFFRFVFGRGGIFFLFLFFSLRINYYRTTVHEIVSNYNYWVSSEPR